jgi:hypothetical protein
MQEKFYKKKEKGCIECRDTGAKTKNIAIRNFLFVPRPTIKNRTRTKRYKIHAEPVRFSDRKQRLLKATLPTKLVTL